MQESFLLCALWAYILNIFISMIFVIQNESPRPVWWFVIRVWIIMVLSDDKSYCLVSSHIQHGLNYHSDKVGLRCAWPGQSRLLGSEALWSTLIVRCVQKLFCARFQRFEGGHLPHFWTILDQESGKLSTHAADIITHYISNLIAFIRHVIP